MTDMLMQKKFLKNSEGFTLLEVVIAMAIMVIAFSAILAVEGGSINATTRAKQMNIVAMLAKNKMVETEFNFEGKTFEEIKKEEAGTFENPYEDYQWKSVIKELTFPNLASLGKNSSQNSDGGQTQGAEMVTRILTNFLSKAIRQVIVTVSWKRGNATQDFSLSTYWVDLNHEIKISEQ